MGAHLACKDFNDRTFRIPNMVKIMDMLEGKPNVKKWNNIHNASMHMMLKFNEEKQRQYICPEMSGEEFALLTPK